MKKVLNIFSLAVIFLTVVSCGTPEITYSDEPLAVVSLNGKWGFIDTKGNEVVPCKYDDVDPFSEGLALVELDKKKQFIDKTGKVIINLGKKYSYAHEFSQGLAAVGTITNWVYIDKTGKVALTVDPKYGWVQSFHDGRAAVKDKKSSLWGFIDMTGAEVIPCLFKEGVDFSGGRAFISGQANSRDQYGNKYRYDDNKIIDINGKIIGSWDKNTGEYSPEGWALHKSYTLSDRIDQVYFVNSEGRMLRLKDYSDFFNANPFSEGLASVNVFNKEAKSELGLGEWRWGFIDKDGKMVIPPIYYKAGEFREGIAAVQEVEIYRERAYGDYYRTNTRSGKWGFIDKSGKTVIPFRYETVEGYISYPYFLEGLALVRYNGKYGFIDKSGNEIIPCKYHSANVFKDGVAKVCTEYEKWGYIDKTGREIIPCEFKRDDISQFSKGLCAVRKNEKWGFIDVTGKEVIPCKYDGVYDFR